MGGEGGCLFDGGCGDGGRCGVGLFGVEDAADGCEGYEGEGIMRRTRVGSVVKVW